MEKNIQHSDKKLIKDFRFYLKIERNLSENTARAYSSDVEALLEFVGKSSREISANDIVDFLGNEERSKLSLIHI